MCPQNGNRPCFGDRPISHAEWQTSTGVAGPPTGGPPTHVTENTPMTTPVTVSQVTSSRRQNIPAAAGHRRRARRSPGRSPGTTDFASRPGFPLDLGWGPLRIGRERAFGRHKPIRSVVCRVLPALVNATRYVASGLRAARPATTRHTKQWRPFTTAPANACRRARLTRYGSAATVVHSRIL